MLELCIGLGAAESTGVPASNPAQAGLEMLSPQEKRCRRRRLASASAGRTFLDPGDGDRDVPRGGRGRQGWRRAGLDPLRPGPYGEWHRRAGYRNRARAWALSLGADRSPKCDLPDMRDPQRAGRRVHGALMAVRVDTASGAASPDDAQRRPLKQGPQAPLAALDPAARLALIAELLASAPTGTGCFGREVAAAYAPGVQPRRRDCCRKAR